MGKDDHYVPLDTETVEQPTSVKNRCKSIIAQSFLFLVVVGLVAMLVIQSILISTVTVTAVEYKEPSKPTDNDPNNPTKPGDTPDAEAMKEALTPNAEAV